MTITQRGRSSKGSAAGSKLALQESLIDLYRAVVVRLGSRDFLDSQVVMVIQEILDHKVLEETG